MQLPTAVTLFKWSEMKGILIERVIVTDCTVLSVYDPIDVVELIFSSTFQLRGEKAAEEEAEDIFDSSYDEDEDAEEVEDGDEGDENDDFQTGKSSKKSIAKVANKFASLMTRSSDEDSDDEKDSGESEWR